MLYREILFFISALGVFNSFLLAGYIFVTKGRSRLAYLFLSLLLLMLSIRVGVSCFYFFRQVVAPSLIQLGLSANVLVGVFLYEYLKAATNQEKSTTQSSIYHVSIVILILFVGGLLYPFGQHFYTWDFHIRYTLHGILTLYLILSVWGLKESWRRIIGNRKLADTEKEAVLICWAVVLTCLGFVVSLFVNYVLGPIFFSLIFYGAVWVFYSFSSKSSTDSPKYANKKIVDSQALELIKKLRQSLAEHQQFKNPNLRIGDLAKSIHISSHQLSQLLNDNLDKSFSTFINEYRIEEAKHMLLSHPNLTIEAIAYEVGFNSKSSFYTAFKQFTQQTPAAFKASQLLQNGSKS